MEDSQGLRGSVTSYVEQEDTREAIDIAAVNARLDQLVAEGSALNEKTERGNL